MEAVRRRLDEVLGYVSPVLPLANAHMVNFITDRHWDKYFPDQMKSEIVGEDPAEVFAVFWNRWKRSGVPTEHYKSVCQFLDETERMSAGHEDRVTLSMAELRAKMKSWRCGLTHRGLKFEQFMSHKKTHEVEVMSYLVANLASLTGSSCVVDVGGGKGYLSSLLSLEYRLKVLGLDSCNIKTSGAARRAKKLQKVWKGTRKRVDGERKSNGGDNIEQPAEEEDEESLKSNETSGQYEQLTEHVSEQTDIVSIVSRTFGGDSEAERIGVVGLHTCGSLAAVCLKQFANEPDAMRYLINVGCCYHLMEEEDYTKLRSRATAGFPLSNYLRQRKFTIGRNARMLALQAKCRISSLETVPSEALMYRAVLQQLLVERLGSDKLPKGQVGRIADRCASFTEYFRRAVAKLQLCVEITDDEIQEAYDRLSEWEPRLKIFFMLRVSLAPVFENIILLDRLLYLKEKGIDHSYLVEMFDPVVSPRCFGLVAFRDDSRSLEV